MKSVKSLMTLLLTFTLAFGLVGCTRAVQAPIPGAANQFDSDTYLSLVTAKSVIDKTKDDLASNAFPASIAGNVKTSVNIAVQTYNAADQAWQLYHASPTTVQQDIVNAAMIGLETALTNLSNAKAGK